MDIAPCNLVEVDRRFRGAYCLHQIDDEYYLHHQVVSGGNVHLRNVGRLPRD